jgi:hypothetical protein
MSSTVLTPVQSSSVWDAVNGARSLTFAEKRSFLKAVQSVVDDIQRKDAASSTWKFPCVLTKDDKRWIKRQWETVTDGLEGYDASLNYQEKGIWIILEKIEYELSELEDTIAQLLEDLTEEEIMEEREAAEREADEREAAEKPETA